MANQAAKIKKTLAESAAELLNASKAHAGAEPFGATNKGTKISDPSAGGEKLGGDGVNDNGTNGISAAAAAAPTATPPGATPPIGSQAPGDIKTGKDVNKTGKVKIGDDGVAREESEDKSEEVKEETKAEEVKTEEKAEVKEGNYDADQMKAQAGPGNKLDFAAQPVSAQVKSYFQSKDAGISVNEDITAIFAGQNLSEEFKTKAAKIYQAAVMSTAIKICEGIETNYASLLEQTTEATKTALTDKVDSYLNLMVEEWVKENQIALDTGLRAELAEEFIGGLKTLFTEHYIDVPADKANVVDALAGKVEELEGKLNEELARSVEYKKQLNEQKSASIVATVCEGLTDTQKDKIKSLAEGVEFTTAEEFSTSVKQLRENFFPVKKTDSGSKTLEEKSISTAEGTSDVLAEEKNVDPSMKAAVEALDRLGQRKMIA